MPYANSFRLKNVATPRQADFKVFFTVNKLVHSCKHAFPSSLIVCFSMQNFAKEFMISDPRELEEDYLRNELKKAGGANYDAQAE